ncbi:MAG: hypothetical protein COV07_02145 [Candidatus Vogelbacteria bacterium CG10_big_fil_rev_8_21_14_0_10_45_14]|uniref:SGNH hydrolase-type esterase domain-containing protein n=1 Tax=Candidatus Vogelbacteria bacterium CG10_big_fil_rev_8_21_14_0_10_45_14 TaxID=1975042 RepID=A0A2H0RK23_9BACT|nr:MAG: hypothetical protein COV07_02145 [Candidatus Vogelbacteria bacterium CG10_big_fil_rev_8_21_14_0_10_45_14]
MTDGEQRLDGFKKRLLSLENEAGAPQPGKGYKIAFLGDSLTSTEWVHPNWREIVEYVLKDKLSKLGKGEFGWKLAEWGIRSENAGFDGATTLDMFNIVEACLHDPAKSISLSGHIDLVMVMGGDNDMSFGRSGEEMRDTLAQIFSYFTERKIEVVYLTPASGPKAAEKHEESLLSFLRPTIDMFPVEGVQFVDLFSEMKKYDLEKCYTFVSEGNQYLGIEKGEIDFVHPNPLGNAYMAKAILDKCFGVSFDPDLYIKDSKEWKMFPSY